MESKQEEKPNEIIANENEEKKNEDSDHHIEVKNDCEKDKNNSNIDDVEIKGEDSEDKEKETNKKDGVSDDNQDESKKENDENGIKKIVIKDPQLDNLEEYDGEFISNIDKISVTESESAPGVELDDVINRLKCSDRNVSNQKIVINGTIGLNIEECDVEKREEETVSSLLTVKGDKEEKVIKNDDANDTKEISKKKQNKKKEEEQSKESEELHDDNQSIDQNINKSELSDDEKENKGK